MTNLEYYENDEKKAHNAWMQIHSNPRTSCIQCVNNHSGTLRYGNLCFREWMTWEHEEKKGNK